MCTKVAGVWTDDKENKILKCVVLAPSTDSTNKTCPITAMGCTTCEGGKCTACKDDHFLEATIGICIKKCVTKER